MEDHAFQWQIYSFDDYNIYFYVCSFILEFVLSLDIVLLYTSNEGESNSNRQMSRKKYVRFPLTFALLGVIICDIT